MSQWVRLTTIVLTTSPLATLTICTEDGGSIFVALSRKEPTPSPSSSTTATSMRATNLGDGDRYANLKSRQYPYDPHDSTSYAPFKDAHRAFIRKTQSDFGWDWGPSFVSTAVLGCDPLGPRRYSQRHPDHHLHGRLYSWYLHPDLWGEILLETGKRCHPALQGRYLQHHQARSWEWRHCLSGLHLREGWREDCSRDHVRDRCGALATNQHGRLPEALQTRLLHQWPGMTLVGRVMGVEAKVHQDRFQNHQDGHRPHQLQRDIVLLHGQWWACLHQGQQLHSHGCFRYPCFWRRNEDVRALSRLWFRRIIDSAVKGNHNSIRVWGGGLYQRDSFYEYCDEKGILVCISSVLRAVGLGRVHVRLLPLSSWQGLPWERQTGDHR